MKTDELSLWGLSDALYNVIENGFSFNEETGEIYFTSEDLDSLEMALDDKLNGICGYIKFSESREESLKARINEIKTLIDRIEKKQDRIKECLKSVMDKNNISKKELKDFNLGTRKSSKVEVSDEESVYKFLNDNPQYKESCIKVKTETSLVKNGLKEILNTTTIPGCMIVESKSIQIK